MSKDDYWIPIDVDGYYVVVNQEALQMKNVHYHL